MGGGAAAGGGGGKAFSCPCEIWLTNRLRGSLQSWTHKLLRCVFLFTQEGEGVEVRWEGLRLVGGVGSLLYVLLPGRTHTFSLENKAYQQKPINPLFHSFFFEIDCQLNTSPPLQITKDSQRRRKNTSCSCSLLYFPKRFIKRRSFHSFCLYPPDI